MKADITLYHCYMARSFRVLWALEELELDYKLELLPFPPRVLKRDYLEINPLGTVPFFMDGETRMTESAAIPHYLASKYGPTPLNVTSDEPGFGDFLNYLHFGEATLTFPQTLVLRYTRLEPPERRLPRAADDYARWFLARLRGVDKVLSKSDYVAAGRFTVADISVGFALLMTKYTGLTEYLPPRVSDYWARLQERKAFKSAADREARAMESAGLAAMPPADKFVLAERRPA